MQRGRFLCFCIDRSISRGGWIATLFVVFCGFSAAQGAGEPLPWNPAETVEAWTPAETISVGTPVSNQALATYNSSALDLNGFLGADRYYTHAIPIAGQGAVTYNMEGGHIWNGHEALQHVTVYTQTEGAWGTGPTPLIDLHATEVGMLIGGRPPNPALPYSYQTGIAPAADLRSAAIAAEWTDTAYSLSWGLNIFPYVGAMDVVFKTSDVVNSSFGLIDPSGAGGLTIISDAYAWQNPSVTWVTAAGNRGPNTNTVTSPASGYNVITVGALALGDPQNPYETVASFSSRGPQSFGYSSSQIIPGVRAAVDIAAPGEALVSAYYGGATGGNNPSIGGPSLSLPPGDAQTYVTDLSGTSFAAPLVAGGASLVVSAAKNLPGLAGNPFASHSMVVKSLLLSGADKTTGWTNNTTWVPEGSDGFLSTTQALDWSVGAGRMNLDTTFGIQTSGTTDVPGFGTGLLSEVDPLGWDYGQAVLGSTNRYVFSTPFDGLTQFNTTLSWQRFREATSSPLVWDDFAQADLTVSFWEVEFVNDAPVFSRKIAESASLYNTVEHLSFAVPTAGFYGLMVSYIKNTFDWTSGAIWGNASNPQPYGLAWSLTAIPEPALWMPHLVLISGALGIRRRHKRIASKS